MKEEAVTIVISHVEGNEAGLWTLQATGSYEEAAGTLPFRSLVLRPGLAGFTPEGLSHFSVYNEQEQCFLLRRSVSQDRGDTEIRPKEVFLRSSACRLTEPMCTGRHWDILMTLSPLSCLPSSRPLS